jgi:hypothetical protein
MNIRHFMAYVMLGVEVIVLLALIWLIVFGV